MLIYSSHPRVLHTRAIHARLVRELSSIPTTPSDDIAPLVDLLIQTGEFEAAVLDHLNPHLDELSSTAAMFRQVALSLGRLLAAHPFHQPTSSTTVDTSPSRGRTRCAVESFRALAAWPGPVPEMLTTSIAEGFAWYALHPLQYIAAADTFAAEHPRSYAVCLGLRGIGTTLSAAVAGTLLERGCTVESATLRPRGDVFHRRPRFGPQFTAWLRTRPEHALFLIVDEGPGLSGSSFCGTAAALNDLGVPNTRIIFFPGHDPAPDHFNNPESRSRWPRHRRFQTSFDDYWIASGRLATGAGIPPRTDFANVSAGDWRPHVYSDPSDWPPVYSQAERRKYLSPSSGSGASPPVLLKFAGLAHYGRDAWDRAVRLAHLNLAPPPGQLVHGFLTRPFLPARPLRSDAIDPQHLTQIGRYLATVAREFPADSATPSDHITNMLYANLPELMGDAGYRLAEIVAPRPSAFETSAPVLLDNRMQPHKWLVTSTGLLKIDASDDGRDHFFPGPQDIAWDIAAATCELAPSAPDARTLLLAYRAASRDHTIASRISRYQVAYLAFRGGLLTHARNLTTDRSEHARLDAALARLRGQLHHLHRQL